MTAPSTSSPSRRSPQWASILAALLLVAGWLAFSSENESQEPREEAPAEATREPHLDRSPHLRRSSLRRTPEKEASAPPSPAPAAAGTRAVTQTLVGVVIDHELRTVASAEVTAQDARSLRVLGRAVTDRRGRFTVRCELARDGQMLVVAQVRASLRRSDPATLDVLPEQAIRGLVLHLRPAAVVTATAVDASGPVPGAHVVVTEEPGTDPPHAWGARHLRAIDRVITADEAGQISCAVRPGKVRVRAGQPGGVLGPPRVVVVAAGSTEDAGQVRVGALDDVITCHVLVLDPKAEPIGDAAVQVSTPYFDAAGAGTHFGPPQFRTDAEGRLALPPISRASFPLQIAAGSARHAVRMVTVRESDAADHRADVEMRLAPRAHIDVELVLQGDRAGFAPTLEVARTDPGDGGLPPTDTPADLLAISDVKTWVEVLDATRGRYRVWFGETGHHGLYVPELGWAALRRRVFVESLDEYLVPVSLPVRPPELVRLRFPGVAQEALQLRGVVMAHFRPDDPAYGQEHAFPLAFEEDGLSIPLALPDVAGSLEVRSMTSLDPPWGRTSMRIEAPLPEVIDVALEPGPAYGRIEIQLTDGERDFAAPGVTVLLRGPLGAPTMGLVLEGTDARGRATFRVPHGTYDVSISNGAVRPVQGRVVCDGKRTEPLRLRAW